MLTSLVYLQQENVGNSKIQSEIVNTEDKNLDIFRKTEGISIKFSGKMCLKISPKVSKNQSFTFTLENAVSEKPRKGSIFPPCLLKIKLFLE